MADARLHRHAISKAELGRFCWIDLATTDQAAAKSFHGALLGWSVSDQVVREGQFSLFGERGTHFASLYQLTREQIADGVPSHWTPYVAVPDLQATAEKAAALGGQIVVPPQDVAGFARICLITDPTGALLGLWQA
jgi:predicted enzyme related to lactoylglutathione lyase